MRLDSDSSARHRFEHFPSIRGMNRIVFFARKREFCFQANFSLMLSLKSRKRESDLPETGPLRQVHPVLWSILRSGVHPALSSPILRSRVPSRALESHPALSSPVARSHPRSLQPALLFRSAASGFISRTGIMLFVFPLCKQRRHSAEW